jgi:hypothetical protein
VLADGVIGETGDLHPPTASVTSAVQSVTAHILFFTAYSFVKNRQMPQGDCPYKQVVYQVFGCFLPAYLDYGKIYGLFLE